MSFVDSKSAFRELRLLLQKGDFFEYSSKLDKFDEIDYQDSDGVSFLIYLIRSFTYQYS